MHSARPQQDDIMESETASNEITLIGRVMTGLGEGKHFMSMDGYKKQFIEKLGIDPYYGTLNLKLSKVNVKKLQKIKKRVPIIISGFKMGDKDFGDVWCYNAEISGIRCALVIPVRSTHTDVAEIISSEVLRDALDLKDGSMVKVTVTV